MRKRCVFKHPCQLGGIGDLVPDLEKEEEQRIAALHTSLDSKNHLLFPAVCQKESEPIVNHPLQLSLMWE